MLFNYGPCITVSLASSCMRQKWQKSVSRFSSQLKVSQVIVTHCILLLLLKTLKVTTALWGFNLNFLFSFSFWDRFSNCTHWFRTWICFVTSDEQNLLILLLQSPWDYGTHHHACNAHHRSFFNPLLTIASRQNCSKNRNHIISSRLAAQGTFSIQYCFWPPILGLLLLITVSSFLHEC